jgi:ankyrin repeat protein
LTALSRAAGNGYDGIVKLLVEAKADIDSKDSSGRTALSWATEYWREGIIKLLLKAKGDLDSKDDSGQTGADGG